MPENKNVNFRNISAEGQDDGKLCWAACMAWWTRATDRLNRDQSWFQEEFSQFWQPPRDGTIDDQGMMTIISDRRWRMYWEPVTQVNLTPALMRRYLNYGAVYLGFYDSNISSPHVNVIYKMIGSGNNPQLEVMEPRHTMNSSDGSFQGAHLTRTLSYYKSPGCTIYIACAKPWSA